MVLVNSYYNVLLYSTITFLEFELNFNELLDGISYLYSNSFFVNGYLLPSHAGRVSETSSKKSKFYIFILSISIFSFVEIISDFSTIIEYGLSLRIGELYLNN